MLLAASGLRPGEHRRRLAGPAGPQLPLDRAQRPRFRRPQAGAPGSASRMARRRLANTPRSTTPRRRCTSATTPCPRTRSPSARSQRVSLRPGGSNLSLISDEDLRDRARNPWLKGRQLWLQIIVRGFWHPTGHLVDYYLAHSQPDRAVALAFAATRPRPAIWMRPPRLAGIGALQPGLRPVQDRRSRPGRCHAVEEIAIDLNPDLRANASRDPDLQALRDSR